MKALVNKNYLYILLFNDKKHFKIGISTNNLRRVKQHNKTYDINYNDSSIYIGERKTISSLESLLLSITHRVDCTSFSNLDGYTEIRDIKDLGRCLHVLNGFVSSGNLKVKNITIDKLHTSKIAKHKRTQQYKKHIEKKPIEKTSMTLTGLTEFKNRIISITNSPLIHSIKESRPDVYDIKLCHDFDCFNDLRYQINFNSKGLTVVGDSMGVVKWTKKTNMLTLTIKLINKSEMSEYAEEFNTDLSYYDEVYDEILRNFKLKNNIYSI